MKNKITVNLKGYMCGYSKLARSTVKGGMFYLIDTATGFPVYSGLLGEPVYDKDSGDMVRIADFSDFNKTGKYFIKVGFRRSLDFEISLNPYDSLFVSSLSAIHTNRCGYQPTAYTILYQKHFRHQPCHRVRLELNGVMTDVSGGWHCGGGYDRDTCAVILTLANLLYSMKLFPKSFTGENRAAVAAECRWGLKYILKLQNTSDGSVCDGIFSEKKPSAFSQPPEEDGESYAPAGCSCVTALRFAAVCALAAVLFRADQNFAKRLAGAANLAWLYVCSTEEYASYRGRLGGTSEDGTPGPLESDFMWCVCEMYNMTGISDFLDVIVSKYAYSGFTGFGDPMTGSYAALAYILSSRRKELFVDTFIRRRLTEYANRLCLACSANPYGVPCESTGGYAFGTAYRVAGSAQSLILAYLISGDDRYLKDVLGCTSYLFGSNPCARAFVTGNERGFVHSPHHRLSAFLQSDECVEGMAVSGPDSESTDVYTSWVLNHDDPPALCYADDLFSEATNEPSVPFTASLIFIWAFFRDVGQSALRRSTSPFTLYWKNLEDRAQEERGNTPSNQL
ncbi:MAG: glycoside hydrolase family 9 protein [Oscillospiraceae bacterium]|nr:glycoside hydrolase family 9 protein [Oscillospiraceae bacterium]